MDTNINALFDAVESQKEMILAAERHIWKNPESGYREWKTHAYMKQKFEEMGYSVTEFGNIPGFYTDLVTGKAGPKLAIFAEMDSLIVPSHPESDPETGAVHSCGHNCQCAAMLGIAAGFKADGALDGLSGSIRLIVVPAEELIEVPYRRQLQAEGIIRYMGGKQELMYRGILDDVDLSFMVHTESGNGFTCTEGSNGCITKVATFTGKGAHAGGSPHLGINALYAANAALTAANAIRETFMEKDKIRFHPIITNGGASVNAIPEKVVVESYIRGTSMEAIAKQNKKLNRAFAAAAASMGCKIEFEDEHGCAPRLNNTQMQDIIADVAENFFDAGKIHVKTGWSGGCSDMGDVCCVMPAVHPHIAGAKGAGHSSEYYIVDPYSACVLSAKIQVGTAVKMLENGAEKAKEIISNAGTYPTIKEYLAMIDANCYKGEGVTYNDDGTVTLKYSN